MIIYSFRSIFKCYHECRKEILLVCYFIIIQNSILAQIPKLCGMTFQGGIQGYNGVIFTINGDSSGFNVPFLLNSTIGIQPSGSFLLCENGKLYGMTNRYGADSRGTIISVDTSFSEITDVYDFGSSDFYDGSGPFGSLVNVNGSLYGMTRGGGNEGGGTIFYYNIYTKEYNKLFSFEYLGLSGSLPYGSMIYSKNGMLYGMTERGGAYDKGVIFSLDPRYNTYNKLYDFDTAGIYPRGDLLQIDDSLLYGMTPYGGSFGYGVIFSFNLNTYEYRTLLNFDGDNGKEPFGNLMQASDGKIYGLAAFGGLNDQGIFFSFDPSSGEYVKLRIYQGWQVDDGEIPRGSIIQASDGKLYGETEDGGDKGPNPCFGTLFSYDLSTNIYTQLHVFDGTNGQWPNSSLTEIKRLAVSTNTDNIKNPENKIIITPNPSSGDFFVKTGAVAGNSELRIINENGE